MSKQFAEFRVGDLFEITPTTYRNAKSAKGLQLSPQVTNTTRPNGVASFEPYMPNNKGNSITFSDTTVGGETLFYQAVGFLGYSHVQNMVARDNFLNLRVAMYIISSFRKAVDGQFDFGNKFNREVASNILIRLPITDVSVNTDTPEPDWEYMENYIKTIERKFIDQVSQVNAREQEILGRLYPDVINEKPEAYGFEEIRVGDIVTFSKGKRVTSADQVPGDVPYVTAATESNGIDAWIANPIFTDSNLATVNFFGKCYYHPYKIAHKDGTYGMKFSNLAGKNGRHYLYFMTALEKVSLKRGSFSKMLTDDLAAELHVRMPVTSTGAIDWDYMENYIAWIETQERERVESYVRHVTNRS